MKKSQTGVPINFSAIFANTPMEFLLKRRGLHSKDLHHYLLFAPMDGGEILKFAFFIGPSGGSTSHISLDALPIKPFKDGEVIQIHAHQKMLNDVLATTVFDIQRPQCRPVSTQIQLRRQPNGKTGISFYGWFRKALLFEADGEMITEIHDQIAIKRLVNCSPEHRPFRVNHLHAEHYRNEYHGTVGECDVIREEARWKGESWDGMQSEDGKDKEEEDVVIDGLPGINQILPDVEKDTKEATRKEARRQLMEFWSDAIESILKDPVAELRRDPIHWLIYKVLHKVIHIDGIQWEGDFLTASVALLNPACVSTLSSSLSPTVPHHS